MTTVMAGAAIPKAPQEIRNRGGQRKVECFECGGCSAYVSRATIRDGRSPHCHCGAGVLVPSVLEDCAELAPDLLDRHPLYACEVAAADAELLREAGRDVGGWSAGSRDPHACGGCGWSRPAGADSGHWLCPKCRGVNDHGTWSRALPFGVEAERARGLAVSVESLRAPVAALPATRAERAVECRREREREEMPF